MLRRTENILHHFGPLVYCRKYVACCKICSIRLFRHGCLSIWRIFKSIFSRRSKRSWKWLQASKQNNATRSHCLRVIYTAYHKDRGWWRNCFRVSWSGEVVACPFFGNDNCQPTGQPRPWPNLLGLAPSSAFGLKRIRVVSLFVQNKLDFRPFFRLADRSDSQIHHLQIKNLRSFLSPSLHSTD